MTSLKQINSTATRGLEWPRQLITPSQLMLGLQNQTKISLIRAPLCSKIILQIVGSCSYLLARVLNKTKVANIETFNQELRRVESQLEDDSQKQTAHSSTKKPVKTGPLLTLSNHISCIDDPILWASLLPLSYYSTNTDSVRWSAAALEICFSKPWHSTFFSLGRTFPVRRGDGLEQPAMDYAAGLLRCNQWLHMFPEGRVMRDANQQVISNKERGYTFKWGVAKLILDYLKSKSENTSSGDDKTKSIRILPFYHMGMDEVQPIGWPYIPKFGKQITIFIRPLVIDMNFTLLNSILSKCSINHRTNKSQTNDEINRIKLTNYLEEQVEKLIEPTAKLHSTQHV